MSDSLHSVAVTLERREFLQAALLGGLAMAAGPLAWTQSAWGAEPVLLPPLPYAEDALAPTISARTISFHYGKHHAGYVSKTNELLQGSGLEGLPLEEVVQKSAANPEQRALFNNAAQVWNHTFYWQSMKPGGGALEAPLLEQVVKDFGSREAMEQQLTAKALGQFGSGWAWLVWQDGKLACVNTGNADTPLTMGQTPLLCIDVWEHAYYLDYQNRRADYVKDFLAQLANWEFARENLLRVL